MSTLMFYKKLVPLHRELHRDLRLKPLVNGFAFAANENAMPVALVEFAQACIEYPIVFAMDDEKSGGPIILTGIREKENLFVTAEGKWDNDYIPAFVRRYPFVLHEHDDGQSFTVLIDEECPGFNAEDGDRVFAEDGSESPMFARAVQFLDFFKGQGHASRAFVMRVQELGLLIPQGIDIQTSKGEKMSLQGFHVIDEKKLVELDDAKLLQLARSGDLALIYAHLASLGNVPKLLRRLEPRLVPQAA